jgi:hypothetical protein
MSQTSVSIAAARKGYGIAIKPKAKKEIEVGLVGNVSMAIMEVDGRSG